MSYSIYVAQKNSDMNEGRGPMINIAAFTHKADAMRAAKGQGVMGVGDGDVVEQLVHSSFEDYDNLHTDSVRRRALSRLTAEEQRALGL